MGNCDGTCFGSCARHYFDTIPHERLMTLLKERVADGRVLALVESFLRAGVNRTLRGWYGYFQHSQANVFASVDGYVRRRLRSLLEMQAGPDPAGAGRRRTVAGRTSGLRAVGCCPWQRPTSGRGQSQRCEPADWRAGCGRPARPVRREGQGSIPCPCPCWLVCSREQQDAPNLRGARLFIVVGREPPAARQNVPAQHQRQAAARRHRPRSPQTHPQNLICVSPEP